jgi:transposase InsO family protein
MRTRRLVVLLVATAVIVPAVPAAAASPSKAQLSAQVKKLKRANRAQAKRLRTQAATIKSLEGDLATAIRAVPREQFRAAVLTPAAEVWPCIDTTVDREGGVVGYWSFTFSAACEATDYDLLPY